MTPDPSRVRTREIDPEARGKVDDDLNLAVVFDPDTRQYFYCRRKQPRP